MSPWRTQCWVQVTHGVSFGSYRLTHFDTAHSNAKTEPGKTRNSTIDLLGFSVYRMFWEVNDPSFITHLNRNAGKPRQQDAMAKGQIRTRKSSCFEHLAHPSILIFLVARGVWLSWSSRFWLVGRIPTHILRHKDGKRARRTFSRLDLERLWWIWISCMVFEL